MSDSAQIFDQLTNQRTSKFTEVKSIKSTPKTYGKRVSMKIPKFKTQTTFYKDGKKVEMIFKNHTKVTEYNSDENVTCKYTIDQFGNKYGSYITFWPNGYSKDHLNYFNDVLNGYFQRSDKNGNIIEKGYYRNGKLSKYTENDFDVDYDDFPEYKFVRSSPFWYETK
jgi:antitoxin component YwqK of YwqJK toxin-antitoxin module